MPRRHLALTLVPLLISMLAACGGEIAGTAPSGPDPETGAAPTIVPSDTRPAPAATATPSPMAVTAVVDRVFTFVGPASPSQPAAGLPEGVDLLSAGSLLGEPGTEPVDTSHLNTNIISLGTYTLGTGVDDQEAVQAGDEVYYILEGEAILDMNGEKIPVLGNLLVYVHAGFPHHFEEIAGDIQALVFLSKRGSSEDDPAWLKFDMGELMADLDGSTGETTFLDAATLDGRLVKLSPGETSKLAGGSRAVYLAIRGVGNVLLGDSNAVMSEGMLLYFPRDIPTTLVAGERGFIFLEVAATQ